MNDNKSAPDVFIAPASIVTETTVAKSELKHYITDDELDRLGDIRRDIVREVFWAAIGALAGSLMPAIDAVARLNAPANPMGALGLLQIVLAALALGIAMLAGYLAFLRGKKERPLADRIRSRERVRVMPTPEG